MKNRIHMSACLITFSCKYPKKVIEEAAKITILNSRASTIKEELNSDTNPCSMWCSLCKLLHSRPTQNYTEDECSTHSIHFSSQRSPKFMNPLPTPSPHHPYLLFLPGNSLAPLYQSSNLCLQKRFLSSFVHCPLSHLLSSLPTTLLKKYVLILSPILSKLANLSTGTFPSIFKRAQVFPLLNKPSLDPTSPANYRPISNLSTMSKLLRRFLLSRIRPHIITSSISSSFQSAYSPGFSTETTLSHIFNNRRMWQGHLRRHGRSGPLGGI